METVPRCSPVGFWLRLWPELCHMTTLLQHSKREESGVSGWGGHLSPWLSSVFDGSHIVSPVFLPAQNSELPLPPGYASPCPLATRGRCPTWRVLGGGATGAKVVGSASCRCWTPQFWQFWARWRRQIPYADRFWRRVRVLFLEA